MESAVNQQIIQYPDALMSRMDAIFEIEKKEVGPDSIQDQSALQGL